MQPTSSASERSGWIGDDLTGSAQRAAAPNPRPGALAKRYQLPVGAGERLCSLLDLLVRDPLAPTSVRDPSKVVDDHLADSLEALELEELRSAARIVDLGSGAGLPGLPLAIALPRTMFTLVESATRKCAFIERAVVACELDNAEVVQARIESAQRAGGFDLATARALAPLEVVVEYAAPLLRMRGTLVVWRGRRDALAESAAARAASEVGLEPVAIRPVRPYPEAAHRHLHVFSKVMETPSRFPRRPGVATKRPLGPGEP